MNVFKIGFSSWDLEALIVVVIEVFGWIELIEI